MTVFVGFSKPRKWKPFAWLIKVLYRIPFSHVYFRIPERGISRDVIYQASNLQVNFMSCDIFMEHNDIVREFDIEITDEVSFKQFCIDNCGKPYGMLEAIGLGIVRIFELFGRKIDNPFGENGKTYVCSELVGTALNLYSNIKIDENYNNINPLELYNCIERAMQEVNYE